MSVFEQFTAKKSGGAEGSAEQQLPQESPVSPEDVRGGAPQTDADQEKSSGWSLFNRKNLIKGSFLDGLFSLFSFAPKSGGYHDDEDSSDKGVTALLAALYYVFLIIVLIFVIDQACSNEPKLSKFNPFVS